MIEGLRSITALSKDSLRGVLPASIDPDEIPTIEFVDPRTIFVEESYQRAIGEAGIGLIRKIYSTFSWARFKPPICVRRDDLDGILVCIDGQHTAISTASHPKIPKIPVMIVKADTSADRAAAFVGHNRDRVQLTAQMIYFAELQAGDELAIAVDAACRATGATILPKPVSLKQKHPIGSTVAIGTMKVVVKRRGIEALKDVLRILVAVGRGPIKADEIAACSIILAGRPDVADRLQAVIASKTTEAWAAIGIAQAAETGEPIASAVAAMWCRELGIKISGKTVRASGNRSAVRAIDRPTVPKTKKPDQQFDPAARLKLEIAEVASSPVPAPKAQPVPPPAVKATVPMVRPSISRNGIIIDFSQSYIVNRGRGVHLSDDVLELLAALLAVMPSLLDGKRLASKVFGSHPDGPIFLHGLIDQTNPALASVNLEIRTVKNIGHCLADTGA